MTYTMMDGVCMCVTVTVRSLSHPLLSGLHPLHLQSSVPINISSFSRFWHNPDLETTICIWQVCIVSKMIGVLPLSQKSVSDFCSALMTLVSFIPHYVTAEGGSWLDAGIQTEFQDRNLARSSGIRLVA